MYGFLVKIKVEDNLWKQELIEVEEQFFDSEADIWAYALRKAFKEFKNVDGIELLYC